MMTCAVVNACHQLPECSWTWEWMLGIHTSANVTFSTEQFVQLPLTPSWSVAQTACSILVFSADTGGRGTCSFAGISRVRKLFCVCCQSCRSSSLMRLVGWCIWSKAKRPRTDLCDALSVKWALVGSVATPAPVHLWRKLVQVHRTFFFPCLTLY